jgi:hypothetical protein
MPCPDPTLEAMHIALGDEGAEGLVLGGGRGATLHCEMTEECGEVGGAEVARVTAAMIADEGPDPVSVRLLGAGGAVQAPEGGAHGLQQVMAMVLQEVHRHKQGRSCVGDEE